MIIQTQEIKFLKGGGEMGELTRNFDWTKTKLGDPENWPKSLQVTLSILLNSKFPMFLWWGDDMIQFYNDAYRPSLGNNGKHPIALGQEAEECWAEIWDIIFPLIKQVRDTGEATWSEDQLVPIYRNGKIEDVWWTFGYSPIYSDSDADKVEGVLVVCTETTEKVLASKALAESEESFRTMAENIPNLAWMADSKGWIYWYNTRWYEYTGKTPAEMEGWGWQSVHDQEYLPKVMDEWKLSLSTGKPFDMVFPLKGADGIFKKFLTRVVPVKDKNGILIRWFGTNTDISNEISIKEALEESEARFRVMAEGTIVMISISDESNNATYFNPAWLRFTGRAEDHLLKYGWADLIHSEDRQKFVDIYLSSFAKQEPWIGEFRVLNAEKEYRWLYATGSVRRASNGKFAGYISSTIDISERKKVEKIQIEAERKLRGIIDAAPPAIALFVGRDLIIEMPNKSFIEVVGKGDDIEGKPLREVMPELEAENQPFLKILDDVFVTGKMFQSFASQVNIIKHGVRSENYYNITYSPLFDDEGNVYAILDVAIDVTEEVKAKERIAKSEENLRNIILQAPVAMTLLTGSDYVVEIANERMYELWGRSGDELAGKPIFVGLPEVKNQGFEDLLKGVLTTGKTYTALSVPLSVPRNNQLETIYINFVYEPYKDLNGNITGVMAVAYDVTSQVHAQKQIEEIVAQRTKQLEEANINLQKSNSELEQFAYIASHDLQEPLRKVTTYSYLLRDTCDNDQKQKKYLDKVIGAGIRMQALIKDVLTYSAVHNLEPYTNVDLNHTIEGILIDLELTIKQKSAIIKYDTLPIVNAVGLQMTQLFYNLISNSLKFTKKHVNPIIEIKSSVLSNEEAEKLPELDSKKSYLKIEVMDNGIGFSETHVDKIFNIFQRLHLKSEFEGTGIGLAMCKKIVENHKGLIKANSDGKSGSVFTIFLPYSTDIKN